MQGERPLERFMPTIAHVRLLATLCLTGLLVLAVTAKVSATQTPPNAAPPAATKSGGGVGKLDGQQKAEESKQTNSSDSHITPCKECLCRCPIEQPHAQSEEEKAKAASLDRLYRRYMLATIIGVGAGIVGAIFLILSTALTRQAANAALLNARAVINAQQPLLTVELGESIPYWEMQGANLVPSQTMKIKHYGPTPAWVIEFASRFRLMEMADFRDKPLEYGDSQTFPEGTPLPPDQNIPTLWEPHRALSAAELEEIKLERSVFVLYGFVKYSDVFTEITGKIRETYFCYRYFIRSRPEDPYHRNPEFWRIEPKTGANKHT
jgi:hypothetical protein